MKEMFCKQTSDITLILSEEEARQLKRSKEATPCLTSEGETTIFHIMNTQTKDYIKVKEPVLPSPGYWITLGDVAYRDLLTNKRCGTRYGDASKINVLVNDSNDTFGLKG